MNKLKVGKSERSLRPDAQKSDLQLQQSLFDTELNDGAVCCCWEECRCYSGYVVHWQKNSYVHEIPGCCPETSFPVVGLFDDYSDDIELRIGERWLAYDSSDSDSDSQMSNTISNEIAEWAVTYHIPLSATGALLKILKPHLPSLPKDPRTLENSNPLFGETN